MTNERTFDQNVIEQHLNDITKQAQAEFANRYIDHPHAPSLRRFWLTIGWDDVSIRFHNVSDDRTAEVLSSFRDDMEGLMEKGRVLQSVLPLSMLPFEISAEPEIYLGDGVTAKLYDVDISAAGLIGKLNQLPRIVSKIELIEDAAPEDKLADNTSEWLILEQGPHEKFDCKSPIYATNQKSAELKAAARHMSKDNLMSLLSGKTEDLMSYDLHRLGKLFLVQKENSLGMSLLDAPSLEKAPAPAAGM